jgi:hypothetical protein
MITDYIPIRYSGGAGGNFLAAWFRAAKMNQTIDQERFSTNGNAHNLLKDAADGLNAIDDEKRLNAMLNCTPILNSKEPYYIPTHYNNLDQLKQYYSKIITISYDYITDARDISASLYKKLITDVFYNHPHDVIEEDKTWTKNKLKLPKDRVLIELFKEKISTTIYFPWTEFPSTDQYLCIKLYDLLYKDPEELITIVSDWTTHPNQNWDRLALIKWRTLTLLAIEQAYKEDTRTDIWTQTITKLNQQHIGQQLVSVPKYPAVDN